MTEEKTVSDKKEEKNSSDEKYLAGLLEAAIFLSYLPITVKELTRLSSSTAKKVKAAIETVKEKYDNGLGGIRLVETAGGYRFETDANYGPVLKGFFVGKDSTKLSRAAMETLAIIAYKQPVTAPEINEIRSVDSGGVVQKLLQRKLIKIIGRKEVLGRPLLYSTTKEFLARFGLSSIDDLPSFDEFIDLLGSNDDKTSLRQEFEEHITFSKETINATLSDTQDSNEQTEDE